MVHNKMVIDKSECTMDVHFRPSTRKKFLVQPTNLKGVSAQVVKRLMMSMSAID